MAMAVVPVIGRRNSIEEIAMRRFPMRSLGCSAGGDVAVDSSDGAVGERMIC